MLEPVVDGDLLVVDGQGPSVDAPLLHGRGGRRRGVQFFVKAGGSQKKKKKKKSFSTQQ